MGNILLVYKEDENEKVITSSYLVCPWSFHTKKLVAILDDVFTPYNNSTKLLRKCFVYASSIVCSYQRALAAPRGNSVEFHRRKVKVTMLKDREKKNLLRSCAGGKFRKKNSVANLVDFLPSSRVAT